MTDPLSFAGSSPRFNLPMLFAGQAQKEFFVNEAHALTDVLLHPAVESELQTPPADAGDGECWLVGANPTGPWSGRAGQLASWQQGAWLFIQPRDGMRMLDRSTGQEIRFCGDWVRPALPESPTGGAVIDAEARGAIDSLVATLVASGILPAR